MTTRNDRVIRRRRSNGCDQFSLDAVPAITILDHRLVHHFEKHKLRIAPRQMRRKSAPELRERLDATLVVIHPQLELVTRMNIDDNSQAGSEDHVERTIDTLQVSAVEYRWIGRVGEQRRGLDRKAHMVETHRLDQRDIRGGGMRFEPLFRVNGRLREPVTEIDAASQTPESRREIHRFFLL